MTGMNLFKPSSLTPHCTRLCLRFCPRTTCMGRARISRVARVWWMECVARSTPSPSVTPTRWVRLTSQSTSDEIWRVVATMRTRWWWRTTGFCLGNTSAILTSKCVRPSPLSSTSTSMFAKATTVLRLQWVPRRGISRSKMRSKASLTRDTSAPPRPCIVSFASNWRTNILLWSV